MQTTRDTTSKRLIAVKIKRQDGPERPSYWQSFQVPWAPQHNVLSVLMEIRRRPVTADGAHVAAPVWESSCLEEVCGACTMVVNGRVRQGCTALVDQLAQPITLEPMSKFPVIRDLMVDRRRMFEALKRVKAWVPIDGTYDLGPGPRMSNDLAEERYALSRCMTCGCCLEVCPQVKLDNAFIGAAAMGQAVLMNSHPTGALNRDDRLDAVMDEGGLGECGNAQNCVRACPKDIPLTKAISELGRQTTVKALRDFFRR